MPPPTAPSPHRFLSKPKPPERKPPSSLRIQRTAPSSSQQFAPTPKFSVGSSARESEDVDGDVPGPTILSPLVDRVKRPAWKGGNRSEDIEESDGNASDGADEDSVPLGRVHDDEETMLLVSEDEIYPVRGFKRRRLSVPPAVSLRSSAKTRKEAIYISDDEDDQDEGSSTINDDECVDNTVLENILPLHFPSSPSRRTSRLPTSLASPKTTLHNRFVFSHPHTNVQPQLAHPTGDSPQPLPTHRPQFILPNSLPTDVSTTANPLPEAFSPHRRGQKFQPNGMADMVRGWVVEVIQSGGMRDIREPGAGSRGNQNVQEMPACKVSIGEVSGGDGMVFVIDGQDTREVANEPELPQQRKKWVLIESGGVRGGRGASHITKGDVVAIKQPTWEVNIGEVVWRIGVDWRVLQA